MRLALLRGWVVFFSLVGAIITAFPAEAAMFVVPSSNSPYWQRQWYLRQIQAPEAWQALPPTTKDVVVAVIDAGVDVTHPDLKEAIWTNPREVPGNGIDDDQNGFVDDIHGWNFVSNTPDVRPLEIPHQQEEAWSHGTFVASLIGARAADHVGMVGVNQSVQIMPLTALDGDGYGIIPNVLKAIRYAVNQGASVINLSLAGFDDNEELQEMIKRARDAGVLVVAATGNGDSLAGLDTDRQPVYPVCFDQNTNIVVGVSGTDSLDQHAAYANYGSRCTDLSAPGFELFGARPSYPRREEGSRPAERYLEGMTGTSLAAPLVSGVASLIKSVRPDLTADQIHEILTSTTDRIESTLKPSEQGKMGTGRLNALKAVNRALSFGRLPVGEAATPASEPVVSSAPSATSTEVSATDVSFYYTSSNGRVRWLVAPKPLWSTWSMDQGQPVAMAFLKDGAVYQLKRWFPLTNQESVRTIAPLKNQRWTTLISTTGSSTSQVWLLMSTKGEMRLITTQPWNVLTIAPIKGLPTTAKGVWDAARNRFVFVAAGTKKVWEIDRTGKLTIR